MYSYVPLRGSNKYKKTKSSCSTWVLHARPPLRHCRLPHPLHPPSQWDRPEKQDEYLGAAQHLRLEQRCQGQHATFIDIWMFACFLVVFFALFPHSLIFILISSRRVAGAKTLLFFHPCGLPHLCDRLFYLVLLHKVFCWLEPNLHLHFGIHPTQITSMTKISESKSLKEEISLEFKSW